MENKIIIDKMKVISKIISKKVNLDLSDSNFLTFDCMLAVVVEGWQRVDVISKMQTSEYQIMIKHKLKGIQVFEHKTGANQCAVMTLKNSFEWLKMYADHVRPERYLQSYKLSNYKQQIKRKASKIGM